MSGLLLATRLEEPLQAERRVMSSNPFRFSFLLLLLCVVVFLGTASATSVYLDNPKYDVKTEVGPDAATGGWFIHLGLTGLRVKLTPESPQELEVAYIFPDSPAAGKMEKGDRIVGAGKRPFSKPHTFGYGVGKFSYEGPLTEFADALDAAMAAKGTLPLLVTRGEKKTRINLQVKTDYGKYAKNWPFKCDRSEKLLKEGIDYLVEKQNASGLWHNRPHLNCFAVLALLGDDPKLHRERVLKAARSMARATDDKIRYEGLDCWKYTLYGIALAEIYLATEEKWILPELEEIHRWLVKAQISDGGFGHRPANRPGGNGYGSICILTGQAKMAWALMKMCGIEIDSEAYQKAHEFVDRGTNQRGYVWYEDSSGGRGYADMGRTGAAVLAHALDAKEGGYKEFALRSARCIGEHPDTFSDTHGSPILGMVWTAFGAAQDPASLRKLLDENRWWFTLSQCSDGTFYYQPNRDNNPQDYTAAPRLSATSAAALILTLPKRNLKMTQLLLR